MQFLQNNVTFFTKLSVYIQEELSKSYYCNSELNLKFCENLNFITFDKLNINLGKTYVKLRIFPKIFFLKIGPQDWTQTPGYANDINNDESRQKAMCKLIQSGPEKIAQSLMHHQFATVRRRITRFAPKCSAKIIARQSMQNCRQWVKCSLINNQSWIHVICYSVLGGLQQLIIRRSRTLTTRGKS